MGCSLACGGAGYSKWLNNYYTYWLFELFTRVYFAQRNCSKRNFPVFQFPERCGGSSKAFHPPMALLNLPREVALMLPILIIAGYVVFGRKFIIIHSLPTNGKETFPGGIFPQNQYKVHGNLSFRWLECFLLHIWPRFFAGFFKKGFRSQSLEFDRFWTFKEQPDGTIEYSCQVEQGWWFYHFISPVFAPICGAISKWRRMTALIGYRG